MKIGIEPISIRIDKKNKRFGIWILTLNSDLKKYGMSSWGIGIWTYIDSQNDREILLLNFGFYRFIKRIPIKTTLRPLYYKCPYCFKTINFHTTFCLECSDHIDGEQIYVYRELFPDRPDLQMKELGYQVEYDIKNN